MRREPKFENAPEEIEEEVDHEDGVLCQQSTRTRQKTQSDVSDLSEMKSTLSYIMRACLQFSTICNKVPFKTFVYCEKVN